MGGVSAAVNGGNVWSGIGFGALGGLLGGLGAWGGFAIATQTLNWAANSLGTAVAVGIGAAAAGALSGLISGGDPGMSAIIGGITAGIGAGLGLGGAALFSGKWFLELAVSAGIDAVVGGTVAEIKGGDFWRGAADSAMWGAAGFVLSSALHAGLDSGNNSNSGDESIEDTTEFRASNDTINEQDVVCACVMAGPEDYYLFGGEDTFSLKVEPSDTYAGAFLQGAKEGFLGENLHHHGVYGTISKYAGYISDACFLAAGAASLAKAGLKFIARKGLVRTSGRWFSHSGRTIKIGKTIFRAGMTREKGIWKASFNMITKRGRYAVDIGLHGKRIGIHFHVPRGVKWLEW